MAHGSPTGAVESSEKDTESVPQPVPEISLILSTGQAALQLNRGSSR